MRSEKDMHSVLWELLESVPSVLMVSRNDSWTKKSYRMGYVME